MEERGNIRCLWRMGKCTAVVAWRRGPRRRGLGDGWVHMRSGGVMGLFTSLSFGVFETQTGFKLTVILLHHPLEVPPGNIRMGLSIDTKSGQPQAKAWMGDICLPDFCHSYHPSPPPHTCVDAGARVGVGVAPQGPAEPALAKKAFDSIHLCYSQGLVLSGICLPIFGKPIKVMMLIDSNYLMNSGLLNRF